MSAVYIEYINSLGDTETLSLNATTQVSVKAVSVVPEQLVEAGYDVTTNVINKGFDITFSGIIASGNSDVDPVEYLNKLYALRDSRTYFRVVSGDPNVLTNVHSRCLFKDITRNQNKDVGIVGSHTAYELSFSIKSIRVADLAEVREVRPEEQDLLEPKKSTASTTKEVDDNRDSELYRKAQAISGRNKRFNERRRGAGSGASDRETDVDVIYERLLSERAEREGTRVRNARVSVRSLRR